MVAAYDVYVDLKLKTEQGIEFYKKFKKTLVEFNEKMAKFGEEMNEVEFKLQSKAEKCKKYDFKLAFLTIFEGFFLAIAAAKPCLPPTPSSATTAEPEGPKLKDYLAYYQSKKAGCKNCNLFA